MPFAPEYTEGLKGLVSFGIEEIEDSNVIVQYLVILRMSPARYHLFITKFEILINLAKALFEFDQNLPLRSGSANLIKTFL